MTLDLLKEIILDFQEAQLPTGVPRRLETKALAGKATALIGPRRSGKSTYLFQLAEKLARAGVPKEDVLYVNFFDDRLHGLRHEGPGRVLDAYFSLYPERKGRHTVHCFFDEIQVVPGWESFVDRVMRTEQCEVYITGSSAAMLSKEIATQMRGRALSWEVFPFSFGEHLDAKGLDSRGPLSARRRLMIQKSFGEYWEVGGFPEVLSVDRALRTKIHQEYWSAMLFRDLIERHDVAHPRAVADLGHRLVDNAASLYTVNRLTGHLKALGHRVPKSAVSDYLNWFEDAFFLFTVRLFDASLARANANPKKVYCIDHGLVRSVASGVLVNSGHLLENLVFTALRRVTPDISYYKTRTGREVDFIARMPDGSRKLVQVCESLADPATRDRELKALAEAMTELDMGAGIVVTRDDQARPIEADGRGIEIVPAWRLALDLS